MMQIEINGVNDLPRIDNWNGADGLRRVQQDRLPDAMRLASRSPFNRERLAAAGPVRTIADLNRLGPTVTFAIGALTYYIK
jgi:hypothetical protein